MSTEPNIKDIAKYKLDSIKGREIEYETAKTLLDDEFHTPLDYHELLDILDFVKTHGSYDRSQIFMYKYNLKQVKDFILHNHGKHPKNIDMKCVHYCLKTLALEALQYTKMPEVYLEYSLLITHFTWLQGRLENLDLYHELETEIRKKDRLEWQL